MRHRDAIRVLGAEDAPACAVLSATRGWDTSTVSWRSMLALGTAYGVEVDGSLAGALVLTRFGEALATVAMMIVSPAHGRRGIGRALMERALADAGRATVILYASEMGRNLYLQLGFADAGITHRLEGVVQVSTPSHAVGSRAMCPEDLPSVVALDAEAQGASRARLVEGLVREADRAVVVERDSAVVGFGLSTTRGERCVMGPVVAREDTAALEIVAALSLAVGAQVRMDLAPSELPLRTWAEAAGLAPTAVRTLMVHRGRVLPGRRDLVRVLTGRAYG